MTDSRIVCDGLVKIYKAADLEVVALQGLDLVVDPGELLSIVGASGSGKSTLLNILGGLDTPSAGSASVGPYDLLAMDASARVAYRREMIGFVWQQTARNLVPYLDVAGNIELPMTLAGVDRRGRQRRLAELLEMVGLTDRADHRPEELSGGEQQRAATAVALANEPHVLLADEPTGELDSASASELFALIREVNERYGTTVVVLTHDHHVTSEVDRTVQIRDGRTSTETLRRRRTSASGDREVVRQEFAVLDRAGRLQLPELYVQELGLRERVRLELEPDHVGVWPDEEDRP